jgi:hypothetical protein
MIRPAERDSDDVRRCDVGICAKIGQPVEKSLDGNGGYADRLP